MANESTDNSRVPEIDGAGSPSGSGPSSTETLPVAEPEARGGAQAGVVLWPSIPTTPGGEPSVLRAGFGHGEAPAQSTFTPSGLQFGSPRDSTAQREVAVAPVLGIGNLGFLGSASSTTQGTGELTCPERPYSRDASRISSTPEDAPAQRQVEPLHRPRGFLDSPASPRVASEFTFPAASGPSFRFASTPPDAQGGTVPILRRRRFLESPPPTSQDASELTFPAAAGPSFRFASTPPDAQGGTVPIRRRRRFRETPPPTSQDASELTFPAAAGPSFNASTPEHSTSTAAANMLGWEPGAPIRRRRRFLDSPPAPPVEGGELPVLPRPETCSREGEIATTNSVSWVVWTAGLEGGVGASDIRALNSLVGLLHRELASAAAAPGLWRFSFEYNGAARVPSWRLMVQHDDQLVASWRVGIDAGDQSDVTRTTIPPAPLHAGGIPMPAPASSGSPSTAALGAHGPGAALASPAGRRRRSRWDVPSRTCHSCRLRPVAWFLSCCGHLLCRACVGSGAACSCPDLVERRPVPFRPPYEPQPLRSLVRLRYPMWQIFHVAETDGRVVIGYYNAEQAFYGQSHGHGVQFRLHIFYMHMQGERWSRRVEVRFTLPSHDLELFVSVFDATEQ